MCPCPQLRLYGVYICPWVLVQKCSGASYQWLISWDIFYDFTILFASSCWFSLDKCNLSWLAFGFELYTPVIPEVATSNCLHVHYWRLKGPFQWMPVSITLGDVSLSTVGLSDKKFFRIENISFFGFCKSF